MSSKRKSPRSKLDLLRTDADYVTHLLKQRNPQVLRSQIDKEIIRRKKALQQLFKPIKCPSGQIVRNGYITRNHKIVSPTCIKATSPSGKKGTPLFVLRKGTLSKYGYSDVQELSKTERYHALKKALQHLDPLVVFRKLNALYILNKNRNPYVAKIFRDDSHWVRDNYMSK